MVVHTLKKHVDKLIDKGKMWDNAGLQVGMLDVDEELIISSGGYVERLTVIVDKPPQDELKTPELVSGSDPAAGAEISYTVPTGEIWVLHSILLSLVTDATVADRSLQLTFTDGTTVFYSIDDSTAQPASQTVTRQYFSINNETTSGLARIFDMKEPLILAAGTIIDTVSTNLQAGDNYAAPVFYVTKIKVTETDSKFRVSIDNSPIINNIELFRTGELEFSFNKNEFPISKGSSMLFERIAGSVEGRLLYTIKNAQISDSWQPQEDQNKP